MISKGFELMYIGMGAVFAFLLILVAAMTFMGWFFNKYDHLFPDEVQEEPQKAASPMAKIAAALAVAHSRRLQK